MLKLFRIYERTLKKNPIITSSIQTGILMATSDVLAQTTVEGIPITKTDLVRTARFGGVGVAFMGPVLTTWYKFLSRQFGKTDTKVVLKKVACTQLIFSPIVLGAFLTIIKLLETGSIEDAIHETRNSYVDIYLTSFLLWPFVNAINFLAVPTRYHALFNQTVSVFWNIYLSWRAHHKLKNLGSNSKVNK